MRDEIGYAYTHDQSLLLSARIAFYHQVCILNIFSSKKLGVIKMNHYLITGAISSMFITILSCHAITDAIYHSYSYISI